MLTLAAKDLARLDRVLARRGENATLRRRIGTSAAFVEVGVRIFSVLCSNLTHLR